MGKTKLLIIIFLSAIPFLLFAQDTIKVDSASKKKIFVEDDPVVSMLDSLAYLKVFENTSFLNPAPSHMPSENGEEDIPYFTDSVYRERIRSEEHTSELQSPCNLVCR